MVPIRDVYVLPSAQMPLVAVVEVFEPVQIVKVPRGGRTLAIDFYREVRLVPASITGRVKQCRGAVCESAKKRAGIIDLHRFNMARKIMLPLLDKCLRHGGDLDHWPIEPKRHINVVRKQVT